MRSELRCFRGSRSALGLLGLLTGLVVLASQACGEADARGGTADELQAATFLQLQREVLDIGVFCIGVRGEEGLENPRPAVMRMVAEATPGVARQSECEVEPGVVWHPEVDSLAVLLVVEDSRIQDREATVAAYWYMSGTERQDYVCRFVRDRRWRLEGCEVVGIS